MNTLQHAKRKGSIGFPSRFSQCVDYMRFNEKSFCFRWQETTKLMLFCNTKTSSLVILCDLRYLTGNISSVMTKHKGVQRKLHRFAYLIAQIIFCAFIHKFLMLFCRSILVLCHQHQRYTLGISHRLKPLRKPIGHLIRSVDCDVTGPLWRHQKAVSCLGSQTLGASLVHQRVRDKRTINSLI